MTIVQQISAFFQVFMTICINYRKFFLQLTYISIGCTFLVMTGSFFILGDLKNMQFIITPLSFLKLEVILSIIQLFICLYLTSCTIQFFFVTNTISIKNLLKLTIDKLHFMLQFVFLSVLLPIILVIMPLSFLTTINMPNFLLAVITLSLIIGYFICYIKYSIALPSIFSNKSLSLTSAFQKTKKYTLMLCIIFFLFMSGMLCISYLVHILFAFLEHAIFVQSTPILIARNAIHMSFLHYLYFIVRNMIDNAIDFWRYLGSMILSTIFFIHITKQYPAQLDNLSLHV